MLAPADLRRVAPAKLLTVPSEKPGPGMSAWMSIKPPDWLSILVAFVACEKRNWPLLQLMVPALSMIRVSPSTLKPVVRSSSAPEATYSVPLPAMVPPVQLLFAAPLPVTVRLPVPASVPLESVRDGIEMFWSRFSVPEDSVMPFGVKPVELTVVVPAATCVVMPVGTTPAMVIAVPLR